MFIPVTPEKEGAELCSLYHYVCKNQTFQKSYRTPIVPKHDDLALEKNIARDPQEIDYRCTKMHSRYEKRRNYSRSLNEVTQENMHLQHILIIQQDRIRTYS